MTEQTAIATTDEQIDHSPAEYGDRQTIATFAKRIKAMLPGGKNLTETQAMALAQYAIALDANPFRGEVYGYADRHGFHLVDGYKQLVRWARQKCAYVESYKELDNLAEGSIGFRCYILRDDARATLRDLVDLGASFQEAFDIAATSAVGVVTKKDRTTKAGKESPPPTGWNWEQVARKRALKNTLNLSHGAPSPSEIAALRTQPPGTDDWTEIAEPLPPLSERDQSLPLEPKTRGRAKLFKETHAVQIQKPSDAPYDANGVDDVTAEDAAALIDEQAGEIVGYAGSETDADAYEDQKRIGKDPAKIIEQGKAVIAQDSPHWITDNTVRKRFWKWTKQDLTLSEGQVHDAIGYDHVHQFPGTMKLAKDLICVYAEQAANDCHWIDTETGIRVWFFETQAVGLSPDDAKSLLGVDDLHDYKDTLGEALTCLYD